MDIEFDDDDSGFWQARAVHAMASRSLAGAARDGDRELMKFLEEASLEHLQREDYAKLRASFGLRDSEWPVWSLMNQFWRRTLGPSQQEEELSAQRGEALERAERAEASAFDAMAETAQVAHERDHWQAEAARLKALVEQLEAAQSQAADGEARED